MINLLLLQYVANTVSTEAIPRIEMNLLLFSDATLSTRANYVSTLRSSKSLCKTAEGRPVQYLDTVPPPCDGYCNSLCVCTHVLLKKYKNIHSIYTCTVSVFPHLRSIASLKVKDVHSDTCACHISMQIHQYQISYRNTVFTKIVNQTNPFITFKK